MRKFGLVGKDISYSFSKQYFFEKFKKAHITNACYENFDIQHIHHFQTLIKQTKNLKGVNVTIPYKESIIPYLDHLNPQAKEIGAVNTIKISNTGALIGYNTDYFGFKTALEPLLKSYHKKALILGTGGASKAIAYALKLLNIEFSFVSRVLSCKTAYTYKTLNAETVSNYHIIINCTPLGTFPNITDCPNIPYQALTEQHIAFDLIYNPLKTSFLIKAEQRGAVISNGLKMLQLQAEKAWAIWNS